MRGSVLLVTFWIRNLKPRLQPPRRDAEVAERFMQVHRGPGVKVNQSALLFRLRCSITTSAKPSSQNNPATLSVFDRLEQGMYKYYPFKSTWERYTAWVLYIPGKTHLDVAEDRFGDRYLNEIIIWGNKIERFTLKIHF